MRIVEPVDRKEGKDGVVNEEWQRSARAGVHDRCTESMVRLLIRSFGPVHSGTKNHRFNYVLPGHNIHCLVAGVICRQIYSNKQPYPEVKYNDVLRLDLRSSTRVAHGSSLLCNNQCYIVVDIVL